MKEKCFSTYKDASSYTWDKGGVTITKYGDKYFAGIDPAYEYDHESSLDRKARLRNEKIDSLLGE